MGRFVLLATLGLILVGTCTWAIWAWTSMGEAAISAHGFIAMALGIVGSLVVGCGLMILVFISSRRGYDERVVYGEDESDEER